MAVQATVLAIPPVLEAPAVAQASKGKSVVFCEVAVQAPTRASLEVPVAGKYRTCRPLRGRAYAEPMASQSVAVKVIGAVVVAVVAEYEESTAPVEESKYVLL
jgi:hypothetical protein